MEQVVNETISSSRILTVQFVRDKKGNVLTTGELQTPIIELSGQLQTVSAVWLRQDFLQKQGK